MPAALKRIFAIATIATIGLAASATAARGDCPAPKPGAECDALRTFAPEQLDALSPNQRLHVMPRVLFATEVGGGVPGLRGAVGPGVLFGWSPFDTQLLRVFGGVDALFGEWSGERLGAVTIEPKLVVDVLPLRNSFVAGGVYAESVVPYFAKAGAFGGGAGGGLAVMLINRFEANLGADFIARPNDLTLPGDRRTTGGRVLFSLGADLVTIAGGEGIPPKTQTIVDLRCRVLRTAASLEAGRKNLCAQIRATLEGTDFSTPEPYATRDFIAALPPELDDEKKLSDVDAKSRACVNERRNLQRRCLTCTSARLLRWYTYEIDPRQIAAALGCVEGELASDTFCSDEAERTANEYGPPCN